MNQSASRQTEVDALNKKYEAYVRQLRRNWFAENGVRSKDVYEVMLPREQAEVRKSISRWGEYVTPLAEAWWKERGYGVIWPAKDSEQMQIYKLETV